MSIVLLFCSDVKGGNILRSVKMHMYWEDIVQTFNLTLSAGLTSLRIRFFVRICHLWNDLPLKRIKYFVNLS